MVDLLNDGHGCILLVEDNPDHAELVLRALADQFPTLEVHHAVNGAEALDYLQNRKPVNRGSRAPQPNLILLDLRLPKVDGIDVLRIVKQDPLLCHIPVVMLTSSTSDKDMSEAYRRHVNSYLQKPWDFAAFNRMVRGIIEYWFGWNRCPLETVSAKRP